jgi:hypothetical protein
VWCTAVAVLAVVACDESLTGPSLNQESTLARGDIVSIAETGYRLRFDGVDGDSRCPADAVCIYGGDAVVQVSVLERSTENGYELHTGSLAPVRHRDLTITLMDLQPYPFSSHQIAPDEYRATVRVTR